MDFNSPSLFKKNLLDYLFMKALLPFPVFLLLLLFIEITYVGFYDKTRNPNQVVNLRKDFFSKYKRSQPGQERNNRQDKRES